MYFPDPELRLTHVAANAVAANVAANAAANVAAKLLAAVHVTHAISLLNVNFSNDNCSSQVLCIQSCFSFNCELQKSSTRFQQNI